VACVEPALVARARGVGTWLVPHATLDAFANAPDLGALHRGLLQLGARLEPIGDVPDIERIDRAIARTASRQVERLRRWQMRSRGPVDVFVLEQERRSIRALMRGALQGAPAAVRLAGLLPTPGLPERALASLARQASPAGVAAGLVALGHPDGGRLLPVVRSPQPDALDIEVLLLESFSARGHAAARGGDAPLIGVVEERVDVGNTQTALLLCGGPRDVSPDRAWVDGGRWLSKEAFVRTASSTARTVGLRHLGAALAGTPLAPVLPVTADDAAQIERAYLVQALRRMARAARLDPLGSAPVLLVLFRIDAQARNLRMLAWGAAWGTPAVMRKRELVTPWP
jgi:vacuolar-type H+-ATPase subunit C/Vma6